MGFSEQTSGFYERLDEQTFRPTRHTQGAWREDEQHLAPVAGLVVAALEEHEPRADMSTVRISLDICGVLHADDTHVATATIRPGRTIELLEATATIQDRVAIRGRAWRVGHTDSSAIAGQEFGPIPGPDECDAVESVLSHWPGGYIEQLEIRSHADNRPGRGVVWLRTDNTVFTDGPAAPLAEFLRLADTANGSAPRANPKEWMYPNVDWTAHIFRQPEPGWFGLDVRQSIGHDGAGLTSSTLHDRRGPVGRLEQILTVRPQA